MALTISQFISNQFDVVRQFNVANPEEAEVFLVEDVNNDRESQSVNALFIRSLADPFKDVLFREVFDSWKTARTLKPDLPAFGWDDVSAVSSVIDAYINDEIDYVERSFPKRIEAMVATLVKLRETRSYKRAFLTAAAGNLEIPTPEIGNPDLDLVPLYLELKNHKAMILFPKHSAELRKYYSR